MNLNPHCRKLTSIEGMELLALILDAGLGVKREGVIVVVSLYGNSDHKRGGGWPHGRGEGFARDVAEVGDQVLGQVCCPSGFT